ncbi:MAG: NUDIX hydrolase [Planctomycetota bacterium]|nr:NUDIX hydrolase [Planctomycetota bacterium]
MNLNAPVEVLAEGKYMRMVRRGTWEYAERNSALGAVVIVAVTPGRELVLVEQHRVPVNAAVIELPAGLVGDIPGESTDDWGVQAKRELLEETGFDARRVKHLATGPVSAGFGTEEVDFYLATGLKRVHAGGGVEHENITVHVVPLDRVPAWLNRQRKRGVLVDLKVYAGLYFASVAATKQDAVPLPVAQTPKKSVKKSPSAKRSAESKKRSGR